MSVRKLQLPAPAICLTHDATGCRHAQLCFTLFGIAMQVTFDWHWLKIIV